MPKLTENQMAEMTAESFLETLGIEIVEAGDGVAYGRMAVRPALMAPNGYLHAGSIVSLADSTCGYGTYADLPEGATGFTTAELKSNHLGSAREGSVICKATARHQGRRTQVWDAEVFTEDNPDKPIAIFRCTQMVLG